MPGNFPIIANNGGRCREAIKMICIKEARDNRFGIDACNLLLDLVDAGGRHVSVEQSATEVLYKSDRKPVITATLQQVLFNLENMHWF